MEKNNNKVDEEFITALDNDYDIKEVFSAFADNVLDLIVKGFDKKTAEELAYEQMVSAIDTQKQKATEAYLKGKINE